MPALAAATSNDNFGANAKAASPVDRSPYKSFDLYRLCSAVAGKKYDCRRSRVTKPGHMPTLKMSKKWLTQQTDRDVQGSETA
jgi:hypothetical protein